MHHTIAQVVAAPLRVVLKDARGGEYLSFSSVLGFPATGVPFGTKGHHAVLVQVLPPSVVNNSILTSL